MGNLEKTLGGKSCQGVYDKLKGSFRSRKGESLRGEGISKKD